MLKRKEKITQRIDQGDYENVYVRCPVGHPNIYNRVTDLRTTDPIPSMQGLICEYKGCEVVFNISGDRVMRLKYRWFLDIKDTEFKQKRYRDCIWDICQAAESFFYQAIVNKEIDRNLLYRDSTGSIDLQRSNQARINHKITVENKQRSMKSATYNHLRTYFIEIYKTDCLNSPYDTSRKMKQDKRQWAFDVIERSDIGTMRNQVVHKYAYRPTRSEVEKYDEFIRALMWLEKYLNIKDSQDAIRD